MRCTGRSRSHLPARRTQPALPQQPQLPSDLRRHAFWGSLTACRAFPLCRHARLLLL